MNTYHKYAPNVFLAKCSEQHNKGDIIEVTTKYGKDNESIVFNLVFEKDGFFYYSIVRADGFNVQERAKRKAEKYDEWALSAHKKSSEYMKASQEGAEFLRLAEPIKIGHHSEKRHRALIDRNWDRVGNAVKMTKKAEEHERKAEYWEKKQDVINLSMPECIEYYSYKLEKAKEYHQGLKNGKYPKEHMYSLTYAKKDVNEQQKNYDLAIKLWG